MNSRLYKISSLNSSQHEDREKRNGHHRRLLGGDVLSSGNAISLKSNKSHLQGGEGQFSSQISRSFSSTRRGALLSWVVGMCVACLWVELWMYEPVPTPILTEPQPFLPQQSNSFIKQRHPLISEAEWKIDLLAAPLKANRRIVAKESKPTANGNKSDTNTENPIIKVVQQAGLNQLTQEELDSLPSWHNMTRMYGSMEQPIVVGMERCAAYRSDVPVAQRYVAPAGMFNTGTNALEFNLRRNLDIRDTWQAPWGKHRVEARRLHHAAHGMDGMNQSQALPIIIIRDPYFWMMSMCKNWYSAHWKHGPRRCPNLVVTAEDHARWQHSKNYNVTGPGDTFKVRVPFDKDDVWDWDSLVDLWSDWYRRYYEASYPRLMIRFEDMLLFAPHIVQLIADCAGTRVNTPFQYQTASSKSHGSGTDLLRAIAKTGNPAARINGLLDVDMQYAASHLDGTLMKAFSYSIPLLSPVDDVARER